MASNPVRLKLLQMLKSSDDSKFEDSKQWLTELKNWIHVHCPTLQLYIVTGKTVAWLVIMPSVDKIEELQTLDLRILVYMDKSFQLQVVKHIAQQSNVGVLCNKEVMLPLLHSFEATSDYIIC